jgi:hypothetical protein
VVRVPTDQGFLRAPTLKKISTLKEEEESKQAGRAEETPDSFEPQIYLILVKRKFK